MSVISNVTGSWSSAVTLSANEFWQVRKGPVYIATQASSAPGTDNDGILLSDGDVIELANTDVVRYRSARADAAGEIVRRAKV